MVVETKDVSGTVLDVQYRGSGSGIELTLKMDDGEKKTVDWPVKLQNPLEIVPYEMAFLNQRVRYQFSSEYVQFEYSHRRYIARTLTVFSGPLQGREYKSLE